MQLHIGASLDVQYLLDRKRGSGRWHQHLRTWNLANRHLQDFFQRCYEAILDDLSKRPRIRMDRREPQFFVPSEGDPRLATPYGDK